MNNGVLIFRIINTVFQRNVIVREVWGSKHLTLHPLCDYCEISVDK